jgi:hypothetical protein
MHVKYTYFFSSPFLLSVVRKITPSPNSGRKNTGAWPVGEYFRNPIYCALDSFIKGKSGVAISESVDILDAHTVLLFP